MIGNTSSKVRARIIGLVLFLMATIFTPTGGFISAGDSLSFEVILTHPASVFMIQAGDIDKDGYTDVIFSGIFDNYTRIMYGQGNGDFEVPISYTGGSFTGALDHIDGDDLLDIALNSSSNLYIFLNNGDRTFTIDSISKEYTNLGGVATGYFNDDPYLDIIAAYQYVYYGDGAGNFPVIDTLPFTFLTVYVSDFNNDGIDDIVVLEGNGESHIYLNDGYGNFTESAVFDLNDATIAISTAEPLADFNNDGNADFAFVTQQVHKNFPSLITVGYGDGAGGILDLHQFWMEGPSHSLAVADVNRDHNLDLIALDITNNRLDFFLGDGEGYFNDSLQVFFQSVPYAIGMATGDLDRDGNPDFVSGSDHGDSIKLFINQYPDADILDDQMITTGYSNVSVDIFNPDDFRITRRCRTVAGSSYWRRDANSDGFLDQQGIDCNLQYGEYRVVFRSNPDAPPDAEFSANIDIGGSKVKLFQDYAAPSTYKDGNGKMMSDSLVFYYTVEPISSIQPPNGHSVGQTPIFDWSGLEPEPVPGETYQFQLDRYYDFRAPIYDANSLDSPRFSPDVPLETGSLYYWHYRTHDGISWSDYSRVFAVYIAAYLCGDANGNDIINLLDITFLINYLYKGGNQPVPVEAGDADGNGTVNLMDITYLIRYLYWSDPEPVCP